MSARSRHSVLGILFAAYLLCYMDRMVMASAIPFIAAEFRLSPLGMGGVLSAFFAGYSVMQIPGGMLADRFGSRRVLTGSIVGWSIFTALTGAAGSVSVLLVIRFLFGWSEGPFAPTASKTVAQWFPPEEVGRANGLQLAAVNIGAALAPLIVMPLIVHWGWRAVFYSLLVPGIVLALIVWLSIADSPPRPDREERPVVDDSAGIRIAQVLRMPAVIWCSSSLFFGNIAAWGLMNWLPTYLLQVRGFSISKTGVFTALPYVAGALGFYLGGHLSDKYFSARRHVPIVGGLLIGAGLTWLAANAPSGEWAIVALTTAFLFLFIASAGTFTLPLVIVPKSAVGRTFGVVNTVAQIAAFVSPLLFGYLLEVSQRNFTLVFHCVVGIFVVAAVAATQIRQPAMSAF